MRAMCEKPGSGFWRWLPQVTINIVKALPRELVWLVRMILGRMVNAIRPSRIMSTIREPFYEFFIGIMALFMFPMWSIAAPDLTLTTRIVFALLSLPSFLLAMHGTYRAWGDC